MKIMKSYKLKETTQIFLPVWFAQKRNPRKDANAKRKEFIKL